jgi:hypothetical protein
MVSDEQMRNINESIATLKSDKADTSTLDAKVKELKRMIADGDNANGAKIEEIVGQIMNLIDEAKREAKTANEQTKADVQELKNRADATGVGLTVGGAYIGGLDGLGTGGVLIGGRVRFYLADGIRLNIDPNVVLNTQSFPWNAGIGGNVGIRTFGDNDGLAGDLEVGIAGEALGVTNRGPKALSTHGTLGYSVFFNGLVKGLRITPTFLMGAKLQNKKGDKNAPPVMDLGGTITAGIDF